MLTEGDVATKICLDFVWAVKKALTNLLYCHRELEDSVGSAVRVKAVEHTQYEFDVVAEELLLKQLREKAIDALVFSEEHEGEWIQLGAGSDFIIVADPFDQSTSTMRAFRMAAVAICILDSQFRFKACSIADLNTHLVYLADKRGAYVLAMDYRDDFLMDKAQHKPARPSTVDQISDAFIVCPAAKGKRRQWALKSVITAKAGNWLNVDGVLNLGRLAAGYIDAYLDPSIGQPIYEITCAELVLRAGGIVTDSHGIPFDLGAQVEKLRHRPQSRYDIVASCTESLHTQLLDLLEEDRKVGLRLPG